MPIGSGRFLVAVLLGVATATASPGIAQAEPDGSWIERTGTAQAASDVDAPQRRGRRTRGGGSGADISYDPGQAGRSGCIPARLQGVLDDVRTAFGPLRVTSTCRSRSANLAAGGARRSLHLSGQAVDFRVAGNSRAVLAFLASHSAVGGFKAYRSGLYHIDTGARRPM
jgi:hypothetical protein